MRHPSAATRVFLFFTALYFGGFLTLCLPAQTVQLRSLEILPADPSGGTFASPNGIAAVDLNGDGKSDLVVADSQGVTVLLGSSDGTLQRGAVVSAVGSYKFYRIAVGDFNGDGTPDIVTIDGLSGVSFFAPECLVSVYLGVGNGTFQAAKSFFAAGTTDDVRIITNLSVIAVGDFDRDGNLDLIVGAPVLRPDLAHKVTLALGNGDATFRTKSVDLGVAPWNLVAADWIRDGKLDLAVSQPDGSVLILQGNGDGTFQPAVRVGTAVTGPANDLTMADFNGDGVPDLAVADGGGITILLGNGDGTFRPATSPRFRRSGKHVIAGDFNGDGKPDLAVDGAYVLLGKGDGTFESPAWFGTGCVGPIASGDFNGDGTSDLASICVGPDAVATFPSDGQGILHLGALFGGPRFISVAAGDFNADGQTDLALVNTNRNVVSILLSSRDGAFAIASSLNLVAPSALAVSDFDGDGKADLAIASFDSSSVWIMSSNGDGIAENPFVPGQRTFRQSARVEVRKNPTAIVAGDFNGDGKADLAALDEGGVTILLGNGDGTFRSAGSVPVADSAGIVIADFNSDGNIDIAVGTSSGVVVLLGNGAGGFRQVQTFGNGPIGSIAVGDWNGDGKLDLTTVDPSGLSLWLGSGDGTFQGQMIFKNVGGFEPEYLWVAVAVDFDVDGKLDIASLGFFNEFDGTVIIGFGNGHGTFRWVGFGDVSLPDFGAFPGATYLSTTDLNGDGKPDFVLVRHSGTVTGLINKGQ